MISRDEYAELKAAIERARDETIVRVLPIIREAVDAERDRILFAVRDVAGVEVALKVQLATAPER